jgi:hypothetical protein
MQNVPNYTSANFNVGTAIWDLKSWVLVVVNFIKKIDHALEMR